MTVLHHPSERALADFVAGELPSAEATGVVRHLLKGCTECQRMASQLWPATAEPETVRPDLELQLEQLRACERRVIEERKGAEPLLAELEAHPEARRMLLVFNSRRFHSWFLAERLLAKVLDLGFKEPSQALDYARLAVALTDRLPVDRYGEALVNDIRARSWGALANALRINSDLVGAAEAFRRAEELIAIGTGDPLEEARLLGHKAAYLKARREIRASTRAYDRAIGLYRRVGDHHQMGRMIADKGTTLSTAGDLAGAIEVTRKALCYIDADRDPRAALAAKHNLSLYLHRHGDIDQAMNLLQEILPLYARQNEPMVLLRLRWLEGRLAQTQREFKRAEEAFREVRRGFIDRGIPYEAAAVSFDLATIMVEERRFEELVELASEILAVFRSLGIPRETIAAMELFQRASQARSISVSWVAELAAYVDRSQSKPELRFKPSV